MVAVSVVGADSMIEVESGDGVELVVRVDSLVGAASSANAEDGVGFGARDPTAAVPAITPSAVLPGRVVVTGELCSRAACESSL